jgi:apolipoprotein N-acyltransferase
MALMPDRSRTSDLALLAFGVGALALASPVRNLWASGGPWFVPFVVWFAVILLAAFLARWRKSRDS